MRFRSLFTIFLCFIEITIYAQEDAKLKATALWFDSIVGFKNIDVHKGIISTPAYRVINEFHPYFQSGNFIKGDIYYSNQFYSNVELRYDIYADNLYARFNSRLKVVTVELDKKKIENFTVHGTTFKNFYSSSRKNSQIIGFYHEILKLEHFSFYEKYRKEKIKRLNNRFVYYEFKRDKNLYVLCFEDKRFVIKNNKDFSKVLGAYAAVIKNFNKKNRKIYRSNVKNYALALLQYLNDLEMNAN